MSPLDENHQALLIRLYRMAGDDDAAARQFAACARTLRAQLGRGAGSRRSGGDAPVPGRARRGGQRRHDQGHRRGRFGALRYGAALGREGDGAAAVVLADELAEYR
jgi:hypothetical protein